MRIVFMGSPDFAVISLERLVLNRFNVVGVYTQPDRPAGRGRSITFSPVKTAAQKLGLTVVQPEKLREPEVVKELATFRPDVIVVAAFGQILPKTVLEMPRYGCINIHPSLLPRHRGASPVAAAILAGDEFTGVSIMKMDEGLDTGPVLVQAQIPIAGQDDTGTLTLKLSSIAADMIQEVLINWAAGDIIPRPQAAERATYSSAVDKEQGEIDWCRPAVSIWRQVRAYQPWPGAYTRWQGKRMKILQGFPLPWPEKLETGQVVDLKKTTGRAAFGIATGDGLLGICSVQLEGKRITPAEDFIRGQRDLIGKKLPS